MVWAALPPVPTPMTARPSASSSRLAMALAVTETCPLGGAEPDAPDDEGAGPYSSRLRKWASVVQTVS